jgi:ABC-type transporter Mla maintaining outer membrane lipid asymmetry permease subunit MlaE
MLGGLAMNFVGIDPIKALFATAVINGMAAPPLLTSSPCWVPTARSWANTPAAG